MRVALDARMIDHSGIGAAIRGWLEGMAELPEPERPRLVLLGDPARLREPAGRVGASIVPFPSPIYSLREQLDFPAPQGRWDLLHCPHYVHPLLYRGPMIVTVHDLFHWKYGSLPKRAYQAFFLRRLRRRGCPILTVSEHSRRELVERAKLPPQLVEAIPHGVSEALKPLSDPAEAEAFRRTHGLPESYLLWIGIAQPHKNLERLLAAASLLPKERRLEAPLVLAGLSDKDRGAVSERIRRLGLHGRAAAMGRFERGELPALFAGAIALVFPSLVEGFGFPPLEAF
ncbi:MAG: glycosyltransferase family 1 protein, partial [Candidatus Sumerlaeota bacterium]|nr:glycosyltransferase family 1 protein [Candidatus Sumerlaeota bacterium]